MLGEYVIATTCSTVKSKYHVQSKTHRCSNVFLTASLYKNIFYNRTSGRKWGFAGNSDKGWRVEEGVKGVLSVL